MEVRPDGLPGPKSARSREEFDALYHAGTPAWDIGRPQPAFVALASAGRLTGKVLDVGCGDRAILEPREAIGWMSTIVRA